LPARQPGRHAIAYAAKAATQRQAGAPYLNANKRQARAASAKWARELFQEFLDAAEAADATKEDSCIYRAHYLFLNRYLLAVV